MKMVLWLSVTSLLLSSLTMELHSLQVQPTDHTTDDDARLVGGTSHCAGKLELKNEGEWRRVYPSSWTITYSSIVCRQLDCGTVVSTKWTTGSRSERLWWILSKCDGSESSIRECGSMSSQSDKTTLELVCSESVRLLNGTSSCSGRVEVKSKQSWVSVCEGDFDHHNAEVVCKELDCGTPSVLQGALYGEAKAPMLTKEFHCEGNESALLDCRTSDSTRNTCSSDKTVGLTCSEPDVRLVGGTSHCDGTVEIKHEGEWRLADMNWWNLKSASVVCKQLDCGSAASIEMSSGSKQAVWRICSSCVGSESSLTECGKRKSMLWSYTRLEVICSDSTRNTCSPGETIGHSCSEPEDIRLVGGTSNCTGTLEMKGQWGQWSSVGDYYGWKLESAIVVCRQLNCGSAVSTQRSLVSGYTIRPAWVVSTCDGSESSLRECGTRMSTSTSDTTNHRLEVICSALHVQPARYITESADFRLVGGSRHCTGMVEVKHEDEWNPLNPYAWSQKLSSVACRQLDCGNAVSEKFSSGSYNEPAWRQMSRSCVGSESSLTECGRWDDYYSEERMELTCSGSVRLVKGPSLCSGRVEVKSDQSWVSVCEGDFDQQDAEVVCRQLDCGAPSVLQAGLYRPWYATMSTKDFHCEGSESALQDCRTSDSTRNTCSPDKTVGLTCSEPDLRLSGGTSHCAGIIEMKFNGEWRPTDTFHWNLKQASVVCRQLDCGSAISTKKRKSLKQPVWYTGYECVGSESSLKECKGSYYDHDSPSNNIEVICSESVRLVNGTSSCSGRVEVKSTQSWVSVCKDDFDQQDAEVVCRELGCGAPIFQGALYGEAKAPMSTKEFHCEGSESALLDCRTSDSTRNTCSPDKTVALSCSAPEDIRLGGGTSRCDGIFEMLHQGEWRPVDEHHWEWQTAALVCRQLSCGSVVSTKETRKHEQPVWALRSACGSADSSLRDCILKHDSTSIEVIALTCSGDNQ